MIGHIPELMESGIDSFKIEGTNEDSTVCGHGGENIPEGPLTTI